MKLPPGVCFTQKRNVRIPGGESRLDEGDSELELEDQLQPELARNRTRGLVQLHEVGVAQDGVSGRQGSAGVVSRVGQIENLEGEANQSRVVGAQGELPGEPEVPPEVGSRGEGVTFQQGAVLHRADGIEIVGTLETVLEDRSR